MKYVDRKEETRRLEEALALENSVLIVVYGGRCLGKSTLIKRVLREEDVSCR